MRKERLITRTIATTVGKAVYLDPEKKDTFEEEFEIAGPYNDGDKLLSVLKGLNVRFGVPLYVLEFKVVRQLYGISENDFIVYGKLLTEKRMPILESTLPKIEEPTDSPSN